MRFFTAFKVKLLTGTPAVFVRFSGCNLRCPFCDTEHKEGKMLSDDEIIAEIRRLSGFACRIDRRRALYAGYI